MGFFGSGIGVMNINNASPLSIGFSSNLIIYALNLVLDFDFIEGVQKRVLQNMEWYGAFGLLVTYMVISGNIETPCKAKL